MSHATSIEPSVLELMQPADSILEVACGRGYWGHLFRLQDVYKNSMIVGVDIWMPYLRLVQRMGIYDDLIMCDATLLPIRKQSVDLVFAAEVLEHLSKKKGEYLLNEVERAAKSEVIVTTPWQEQEQGNIDSNPYERHLNFWTYDELSKRGFTCAFAGSPTLFKSVNRVVLFVQQMVISSLPKILRMKIRGHILICAKRLAFSQNSEKEGRMVGQYT
jgi:ubiquinone/menaquinone biosynthesis C-methylase UbiE